ncbi:hypothetical protein pipiens_004125 [Culex pipiens pipiens]|uniref:Uncharacterized protein n=2 Tax=Culex pipiens pipiens TaxID=38569 RepID=A0ABD1CN26_CULPP
MATFEEARANSLRIYFGPGKKEPLDHGIFNFMKQKMRLNPNSLLSMYKESKENCVYIKFKTEEMLTNTLLDLPESMDFEYNKYESTKSKVNQRMEQNGSLSYSAVTAKPPLWLGRGSTHKAGESGGEGQMVVLNNFFGPAKPSLLVPPKLPEVPSAVKPIVQAGVGSSSVEQIVLPMSEPDAEMKETTTAEGVLTGGGVSSLAVPIATDGAVKEAQGEEEFQLVQGRKKKRKEEMRSLSADAPAKPGSGMIFIPPSNLSAAQSMETRGRSKKKEDNKERSRSRSLRDRDTEGKGDTRGKGDVKGKGDTRGKKDVKGNGEKEGVDANLEENL